mmetsp:Transcript_90958/g.217046  ORF Transcript_90958/g.217046 Transcript_90958/m.217046 type:complete len:213 (-) Transcript_90958:587-1225(-)
MPLAHLHQVALRSIDHHLLLNIFHLHHLLGKPQGHAGLAAKLLFWPNVGNEKSACSATQAVPQQHGKRRVADASAVLVARIQVVYDSSQMRKHPVDANSLLLAQLLVRLARGHDLLQALGARQVHQHQLAPAHVGDRVLGVHQALNGHSEETMRPGGVAIPGCFHESAPSPTAFQDLAHLIRRPDGDTFQAIAHEGLVAHQRILLQLQLSLL